MNPASLRLRSLTILLTVCSLFGLAACDDGGTDGEIGETGETGETGDDNETLEIVGDYVDDFMTEHSITEDQWSFAGSSFAIVQFDNDQMFIVAQNDDANEFNPGQWSRFDWTWDGEQLYYCQSVYDGMTMDDALNGGADPSDLEAGCGQFPWSMLTPS